MRSSFRPTDQSVSSDRAVTRDESRSNTPELRIPIYSVVRFLCDTAHSLSPLDSRGPKTNHFPGSTFIVSLDGPCPWTTNGNGDTSETDAEEYYHGVIMLFESNSQ
jgi:hypothetical protein